MLTSADVLQTALYLRSADVMPEPVMVEVDGELVIDVEADNAALEEWSSLSESSESPCSARLERFLVETEALISRLEELELDSEEAASAQYMTEFYDAAKLTFDQDRTQVRTYFRWLYIVLFYREDGPRWGEFVEALGVDSFVELVRRRFADLERDFGYMIARR